MELYASDLLFGSTNDGKLLLYLLSLSADETSELFDFGTDGYSSDGEFTTKDGKTTRVDDIPQDVIDELKDVITKITMNCSSDAEKLINAMLQDLQEQFKIYIDENYDIFLCRGEEKIPVHFTPTQKTLFFFYLLHKEGVETKRLDDYYEEICYIYDQTVKKYPRETYQDDLKKTLDPEGKSIFGKFTGMKNSLKKHISESIVGKYIPQRGKREKDGFYGICLDRSLVKWVNEPDISEFQKNTGGRVR